VTSSTTCFACGASTRTYKRTLTALYFTALLKAFEYQKNTNGAPVNSKECGLTYDEFSNFSRLQWWGLIEKAKARHWNLTPKGRAFVRGLVTVPLSLLVRRNKVVGADGPEVYISYNFRHKTHEQYKAEAI